MRADSYSHGRRLSLIVGVDPNNLAMERMIMKGLGKHACIADACLTIYLDMLAVIISSKKYSHAELLIRSKKGANGEELH
jgi:hypothetical protein